MHILFMVVCEQGTEWAEFTVTVTTLTPSPTATAYTTVTNFCFQV